MILDLKKTVSNIDETKVVAGEIFAILKSEKNFTVFFDGDLGAGKTFLIREVLKKFGINDDVTSPTFIIFNEYLTKKSNRRFAHFDFYRLEDPLEFFTRGCSDVAEDEDISTFVEWPEKISTKARETFSGTKFFVKIKRTEKKGERVVRFYQE